MNPKKIPFTDAYVKEQSSVSLGANILGIVGVGVMVIALSIVLGGSDNTGLVAGYVTMGLVILAWAGLARQRVNTFRENLELYKMIQQLREDKDVAGRQ